MEVIRKQIDWEATGNKLFRLRADSRELRRFVCSMRWKKLGKCENKSGDCENCTDKFMDKSISRNELAEVFYSTEAIIGNWEAGKTEVGIEDLLFYCRIANVNLEDILVYK